MGLEQQIPIPPGTALPWPALAARLAASGCPASMRMIDGLPAFPDEEPPADWRELRLGTSAGMVTLRRTPAGVSIVTWGDARPDLRTAADAVRRAVTEVASGP